MSIVGRDAAIARLSAAVAGLGRGHGAALALCGEPGAGKTLLLTQLTAWAHGCLVLHGRGAEFGPAVPGGLLIDAFDGAPPAGLRGALSHLARTRPVVLALDDLHRADAQSARLVSRLLRRPPAGPVLVVAAYRIAPAGVSRIELAPLTLAQAGELVGAEHARDAYRASGGNPFYLTELARSGSLPPAIVAAVACELDQLDPAAAALARAGAVLGEPFDVPLAAAVGGLSADAARAAAAALTRAGIWRPAGRSRRCFRHPIVGHAVYATAGESWRLRAHARAAERLARRGAPTAQRARHLEHAARWGDREAADVLARAGSAAAEPQAAVRQLTAAAGLLPPGAERGHVLVTLAGALESAGSPGAARTALAEALALLPEGHHRSVALATLARLGGEDEARALLHRALSAAPDDARAELRCELAFEYWFSSDWQRLRAGARDALGAARERADPALLAGALALSALVHYHGGAAPAGRQAIADAAETLDRLDDAPVEPLIALGHAELGLERLPAAARHLERALRLGRPGPWWLLARCRLGVVRLAQGRLAEGEQAAREALARADDDRQRTWAWTLASWAARLRGDLPAAVAAGERAAAGAAPDTPLLFDWMAPWCLAAALLETGDHERARRELLDRALAGDMGEPSARLRFHTLLACAEAERGALGAAAESAVAAAAEAAAFGLPGRIAEAAHAQAVVALARGDPSAAAALCARAVRAFDVLERPIDAARARTLAGRAWLALGDRQAALGALEAAHGELAACGAARYRDEAAQLLRRLGRRMPRTGPRARARHGVAALSEREAEVARYVATGLTNRQIARVLHLSPKTIERQLARACVKLDAHSRAEVAAAIAAPPAD